MSVDATKAVLPQAASALADLQAAIDAMFSRKPLDAEIARRIEGRADKVREELRNKGMTNVVLGLLRECNERTKTSILLDQA